jgi:hypothetical protein
VVYRLEHRDARQHQATRVNLSSAASEKSKDPSFLLE